MPGACHRRHRAVGFRNFLRLIDKAVPPDLEAHLILDNYGTHKTAMIHQWLVRHPRFHLHFTPTGASWLNLVERRFALLTEKQLRRGTHRSTMQLEKAITDYLDIYNQNPKPFKWTKTADQILHSLKSYCSIICLLSLESILERSHMCFVFGMQEVTTMKLKVASRVRGLSDAAFREAFGTEEQCRSTLARLRWRDGFVCPGCGHRGHCRPARRSLYQCNRCRKQTSLTAGTIFHSTKLPLTVWFAAIHLIVTAKNGISSVELGRRLGVKQGTAWTMKQKIMAVMARREGEKPLSGRVEMDDAYLGGVRSGGKRGRGAPGKTPFVAAVSTNPEGRPRKAKLVPVRGFRKREIARGAKRWLTPRRRGRDRRPRLLDRPRPCRPQPSGDPHRLRARGGPNGALQVGQHHTRKHQKRDHRNLPETRPRPRRTLSRQLRLALQPPLPSPDHDPALPAQCRPHTAHPLPRSHCRLTFMDEQDYL